jgi:hypothetical protein
MHDIELMHMRYSLQSVVLALGEMEKCTGDGNECYYHKALSYLREMQNFMEAIKSSPRKVGSSVICSYSGALFFLAKTFFLFLKVAKLWSYQFNILLGAT